MQGSHHETSDGLTGTQPAEVCPSTPPVRFKSGNLHSLWEHYGAEMGTGDGRKHPADALKKISE